MKHVWAIVENVATVLVAYYLFSKLAIRFEIIVVALLLLTYATARTSAALLAKGTVRTFVASMIVQSEILKQQPQIDRALVVSVERDLKKWVQELHEFSADDIRLLGLGLVELYCIYRLLSAV